MWHMMTFTYLLTRKGSIGEVADKLGEKYKTVWSWAHRNSIPSSKWLRISQAGIATLDELAMATNGDK